MCNATPTLVVCTWSSMCIWSHPLLLCAHGPAYFFNATPTLVVCTWSIMCAYGHTHSCCVYMVQRMRVYGHTHTHSCVHMVQLMCAYGHTHSCCVYMVQRITWSSVCVHMATPTLVVCTWSSTCVYMATPTYIAGYENGQPFQQVDEDLVLLVLHGIQGGRDGLVGRMTR